MYVGKANCANARHAKRGASGSGPSLHQVSCRVPPHLGGLLDARQHDVALLPPARVDEADAHVLRHLLDGNELAWRQGRVGGPRVLLGLVQQWVGLGLMEGPGTTQGVLAGKAGAQPPEGRVAL